MLSKFSVKKPYTVVVAVVMVLILGIISFMNLQTDLLPSIDLPYLVVMTTYPGASPEEVEMVVTKPIEQVVSTTNGIKNVSSVSNENSSIVILEFNNDVNMDSAIIDINGSLDLIKSAWSDSIGAPMIIRLNPEMLPIMISSVDIEGMDLADISNFVNQKIMPELENISGVASVSGVGFLQENIEVFIDPDKIDSLNKKLLDKIDRKLSEAGEGLEKAKQEIEDGKQKLASEQKIQMSKLDEGEKALASAKEQIAEGEEQINAGLAELNNNKEKLKNALNEINKSEKELLAGEQALLFLGDNISSEDKVKLSTIQQNIEMISQKKVETNAGLIAIEEKILEVEKEKSLLIEKKKELNIQENQIVKGKTTLTSEMNKAKSQLLSGENTLNEKIAEFEKTREEAFKKSSLKGVVSTKMISGILTAQNFSMPAGYVSEEGTDYLVKVGDKIKDVDEMRNLLLFDTGEDGIGKVYLGDVADIRYKDNSKDIYAKVNGNNAVMLSFQKQSGFSTAEVSKDIREKMDKLSSENIGLNFSILMDQGIYIDIVVDSVLNNLIYGGILAILILLIFLRDIKPTFIIAVSIPISIIFAIAMMYFTGVTINIISLAGLALGVGMLVDNSIVVIENIYRLRNEGKTAWEAAVLGAKEVSGAIFASTLTTACVFLPIVFTKGISRQIFTDMGLTIAYSLFASLIVALTLVPTMASTMLKNLKEKEHKVLDRFTNLYEKILIWSLKYKFVVMTLVVALFIISGVIALSMGTSFIPEMETPQMSLSIKMDKESTHNDIIEMSDTVIDRIINIEGIDTIGAFQGGGGMGGMSMGRTNGNSMSMYIILAENKKLSNKDIEKEIRKLTEDLDCDISVNTSNMDMTALGGSGIEVLIKGREIDTLRDISIDISKILEQTKGTTEISDGIDENKTEMRITVDKEKAMENGLTVAQVFTNMNSLISKDKSSTTISLNNKDYPVIVVDGEKQSIKRADLEDLIIKVNKDGEEKEVKIGDIAKIEETKGLSSINRKSQERYMSVKASIHPDYNIGLVSREFEMNLKDYTLPEGYSIELSGENEMINNSLRDLIYMLLLAIAFIYLIMVAQFGSLLSPFIVMFTIPLAFTGGLLALAITGYDVSLISMLGFLVLSGVVVNNGIVFVDYTNQLRDSGIDKDEALILAGKTRMRPILMTAITTILGLSTLSLGLGVGAEMLQPLAIVAIGGLTYATILTLLVVPVMYSLLHRKSLIKGDE